MIAVSHPGPLSGPVLSSVVGAALGAAATWGLRRGDILAAHKRLFGASGRRDDNRQE